MNENTENEAFTDENYEAPTEMVVTNQLGEETSLTPTQVEFDPEEYQQMLAKGAELKDRKRSVSIVPKYYEFKMSVEMVEKQREDMLKKAKKADEKARVNELCSANLQMTWERFFFQGITQMGQRKAVLLSNAEGLFIQYGTQLIRTLEGLNLPKNTEIEIEFTHEEPNKTSEGSTKIYELYLVEATTPTSE